MSRAKKILVAEGNDIVLALATYLLQRQGFMVDSSASPAEVERLIREKTYDAILLDDAMAGVLRRAPELAGRVVLMTSDGDGAELPVHSVLRKPLEFGLLVDTVKACTDQDD